MRVKVVVFFTASKLIDVEVPDGSSLEQQRDSVEQQLNKELPEVHEGSSFEFVQGFQLSDDPSNEYVDLKG